MNAKYLKNGLALGLVDMAAVELPAAKKVEEDMLVLMMDLDKVNVLPSSAAFKFPKMEA